MIIEINAAGCSDGCRHCAVDGRMPLGAFYSADELRIIRNEWGPLCIRYEPTAHPAFPEIYQPDIALEHGGWLVTNGYGIAHREDWQSMLTRMAVYGIETLSLTLHGLQAHHDWFVCRPAAFETLLQATRRARQHGFQIIWQIFVDRKSAPDVAQLVDLAVRETGAEPMLDVPYHRVSNRLWSYEPYRLTLGEVRTYGLADLVADAQRNIFRHADTLRAAAWLEQWQNDPKSESFRHPFEPESWPLKPAPESTLLRIEKNGLIWHDPLCAPPGVVGRLSEGPAAVADRLSSIAVPPYWEIDPRSVTLTAPECEELHPTGFSLRYKEISKIRRRHGRSPT